MFNISLVRMYVVAVNEKPARSVIIAWVSLAVVMIALYVFFNGN